MKKTLFFIAGIVLPILFVNAQSTNTIKPLSIGDTVPDILFENILNHTSTSANLSDFKGKAVILDFWATWCAPCVAGMPRLDSFQQEFKNSLFILPVSDEKREVVKAFFWRKLKLKLPSIAEDAHLKFYFPHSIVPHAILIDNQRVIRAITATDQINRQVISDLLTGHPINLRLKKDMINFDGSIPLMTKGNNEMNPKLLFRSMILPDMPDLPSGGSVYIDNGQRTGFNMINMSLPHLYLYALNRPWQWLLSRLVFENVTDSTIYRSPRLSDYSSSATEWALKNSFSFDLVAPGFSDSAKRSIMLQTLNLRFQVSHGLNGSLAQRSQQVFLLKTLGNKKPARTRYAASRSSYYEDVQMNDWQKLSLTKIAFSLECHLSRPVLDSTGLDYPVDIKIPESAFSAAQKGELHPLINVLHAQGLYLVPAQETIEVLLFRENNHDNH